MAVSIRAAVHGDCTDTQRSLLPVCGQREVLDISAGLLLEGEDCLYSYTGSGWMYGMDWKFFIRQTCYRKNVCA